MSVYAAAGIALRLRSTANDHIQEESPEARAIDEESSQVLAFLEIELLLLLLCRVSTVKLQSNVKPVKHYYGRVSLYSAVCRPRE
jgi:hypothetical protein